MENFSRYQFAADKVVTNKATGTIVQVQYLPPSNRPYLRLTDDAGERKRVYLDEIPDPAPPPAPAARKGKLSMEDAVLIRAALAGGEKAKKLAKEYGVNDSTIYDVKSGRILNDGSLVYTGKR